MNRIVSLKQAEETYPLIFSTQALIEICEKYNSLKEVLELMSSDTSYQTLFEVAVILQDRAPIT